MVLLVITKGLKDESGRHAVNNNQGTLSMHEPSRRLGLGKLGERKSEVTGLIQAAPGLSVSAIEYDSGV
jgi:hypothetical protein